MRYGSVNAAWGILACLLIYHFDCHSEAHAQASETEGQRQQGPTQLSAAFRHAAKRASPSVVTIETLSGPRETPQWAARESPQDAAAPRDPDGADRKPASARGGVGTGIVIDDRGHVLTCSHVVDKADMAFVRLPDGSRLEVTRILSDPLTDIAVLKIEGAAEIKAAALGNPNELENGDWVLTIGNPYSLGLSVSTGVVSATRRHLRHAPYVPLIQTDAATNPGNSGGALVNLDGEVVGVSEGGYGVSGGFEGIGFSIPIDLAAKIARELIEKGEIIRPYFGFETEVIDPDLADHLELKGSGVIVCDVLRDSPAEKAGIQAGDVLTHVAKAPITDHFEFFTLVDRAGPGRPLQLTIFRDGAPVTVEVLPDALGAPPQRNAKEQSIDEALGYLDENLGMAVDEASAELAKRLGYRSGVDGLVVTFVSPGSIAGKQGVCAGMMLFCVDGERTKTVEEFRLAMRSKRVNQGILLLMGSGRRKHFVLLKG